MEQMADENSLRETQACPWLLQLGWKAQVVVLKTVSSGSFTLIEQVRYLSHPLKKELR